MTATDSILHPTAPLGHVARVLPSGVDKKTHDGEVPVRLCNYTDIYYHDRITADFAFMEATATDAEIERFTLRPGDVVMTKDSETANDIAIPALVAEDLGGVVLGYHNALVRPDPTKVEPRYLFWALMGSQSAAFFETKARGVTRVGLRADDMAALPVPVPSLDVQRRVADMLDAETARIDTLIAKNDHVCSLLDLRRAALLEDRIYRRNDAIPTPLQYLCDPARPIRYGIVLPGPDVDDGVPLIKGGDVHSHTLHQGTQCRVDAEIERAHTRSRVRQGDLVYAIRGSFGDVESIPGHLDGANITQDVARIAPRTVDARWLLHALRAPSTLSQAKRSSRGATISGVNIESLRAFVLPVPSMDAQTEVRQSLDRDIARLDGLVGKVKHQQHLLRQRRQALITAAVTGQITV